MEAGTRTAVRAPNAIKPLKLEYHRLSSCNYTISFSNICGRPAPAWFRDGLTTGAIRAEVALDGYSV